MTRHDNQKLFLSHLHRVASSRVSGLEGRLKTANTSLAESEAKVEALEVTNSELEKSKAKEVAKTAALKKSLTEDLDRVRTDFKVIFNFQML